MRGGCFFLIMNKKPSSSHYISHPWPEYSTVPLQCEKALEKIMANYIFSLLDKCVFLTTHITFVL